MTVEMVRSALLWCVIINAGWLFLWFMMFALARDWIYRMHGKWFKMSQETFHAIHYAGMAILKLCTVVFFLVPYLALLIVS
jgi:hypothetical protein